MINPLQRCLIGGALAVALAAPAQADTLTDVYTMALENDPVLRAAEATFRAGQEFEAINRAPLLPQLDANASYGESDVDQERTFTAIGQPSRTNTQDESTNYSISLSQNLFNLPAWFSFKRGQELSKQAEANFSAAQQDLIVRTATAYFNVLRELSNLESSRAEEAAFKRQYEQTQQRFEVGLIAITDVHEAKAAYDLAVVRRLSDEGNLGIAYEGLTVITGQPHANLWLLSEEYPVQDPDPLERSEWVDFALENNYELKARKFAAEASRQASNSAKAEHLPTLTGGIQVFDNDTTGDARDPASGTSIPFEQASEGYGWEIRFNMPLYSGGGVSAQRRRAAAQWMAEQETYTSTLRNTIQNTRSLHLAVVTDVQRVAARQQAIVSAQSALDATIAGYEVGTRNVVDVLQSQRVLFNARRDYANSRFDYVVNRMRLLQSAGLLNPGHVEELNRWLEAPPAPSASTTPGST